MMKIKHFPRSFVFGLALCAVAQGQAVNGSQQVVLEGLRANAGYGSFVAAAYAADGSLLLLYDQHDGVRLLKTDAAGATVLAQAQVGAAGDAPVGLAVDPAGNVYVTGTTSSGTLKGTAGAAFGAVADSSTNSFLAKFDASLNLKFLTFLGAGRTAVAGVAATADAAFVTGVTFNAAFPVTAFGIQQAPARGTSENGFVERFSADGSTLVYATYLTGVGGNTMPAAIVADSSDKAYVAGATSASGYPTIAALQTTMLGTASGFLSSLNAAGSAFGFSTFIAGGGITGLALDASTSTLLLTGNVSLGQFPVATVATPLSAASYQTLLRIPVSGQAVSAGVVLAPGTSSRVSVGAAGSAWIAGALTTPLFPGQTPPDYNAGDSFLLHVTSANTIDQTLRLGGLAVNDAQYASLTSSVGAPAVSAAGTTLVVPGKVSATVDASLLATQRFDLPLVAAPNAATNALLPNTLRDVMNFSCVNSSQCSGTGGLLAMVSTAAAAPSLSVSADDLPNLTLRNLGSATANGLVLAVSGYTLVSNCAATLAASSACAIALTGAGPGTLTVSAANAPQVTLALGANTGTTDALALSADELDFGLVSSVNGAATATVTVTNLSASSQTFPSAQDGGASAAYSIANVASTCAAGGAAGTYSVAAGAACTLTLGLTVSSTSANDGPVRSAWKIGPRDVMLTGFAQAAALNVSAAEVDFGTIYGGGLRTPRYLYLSNNSNAAVAHAAAGLPGSSAFSVADGCPSVLEPHSVCQLVVTYAASGATSSDAAVLTLDEGLSVLITGETLPAVAVTGAAANPSLSVSATALTFATAVAVTQVSSTTQSLTVTNTGGSAFALTLAVTGDFALTNGCGATLSAGASCKVSVSFAPSAPGERDGLLSLTAGSGFTPTYVALTGTGSAILPANNGTLAVGQTFTGEPIVAWYKLQQAIASLTAVSGSAQFGVVLVEDNGSGHGSPAASAFTQSATLACADCWLGVQFLSQTAGTQAGTLTLTSTAGGNAYVLALTATALPVQGVLLTPLTEDFGTVAINSSSAPVTFTLTDLLASASAVTVQSVAVAGDFTLSANTTGGAACSGTLAATASCFVQVVFSPTATGQRSGTLTVVTSGGTVTAALTGYGMADPGLAINPTSLTFANAPGSGATQQTVVLSNTGAVAETVGAVTASDPSFTASSGCATLLPGTMCSIAVIFTPQTATTAGTLTIPVTSMVNGQALSATYTVALTGAYTTQGAGLQMLPGPVNFGSTATGSLGATRMLTLNNLSGKALVVSFMMPREFPLATPGACPTLAAGASCTFAVSFLPVTGGALTGSVVANGVPTDGSAAVQTLGYMLGYGAASGALTVSGQAIPFSPVSFGQVTSGQSMQQTLTLTNSGTANLTVHRMTTAPPFYSTSNCGAVMAAGASCSVVLTYAPSYELTSSQSTVPRQDSGTLTIESDAATSPDTVSLAATVAPVVSSSPASSAALDSYALSESALTYANTQVGSASAVQAVSLTNVGTATIHVLSVSAPVDFTTTTTCATLLPGAVCTLSVAFTPTAGSSTTLRSGAVQLLTDASDSLEYISVMGTSSAAPLTLSPAALDFGTVNVGANDSVALTVSNTSTTPVMFTTASATGDYAVSSGTCPASGSSLAGGSSCTLNVTFTPTATGTRTGTLSLATNATPLPLTDALTGVGVQAHLQVTPGALAFGSVDVGAPASLTLTLLNTGSATVTNIANAIAGAGAAAFLVAVPCPVTSLAPNQGCTETVTFTPPASGASVATLMVASSDPAGPAVIALSGTGIAGGSFVLTVSGGSAATVTVASGSPASYPLTLTPLNGFTGPVALTCTPVNAGQYASCSLLASSLTLNGGPQTSTATLNTISSQARGVFVGMSLLFGVGFFAPRRRRFASALLLMVAGASCLSLGGCGSGPAKKVLYTPAGMYQYTVTASATGGLPQSSTVTLNLVVQ
jgi:hypothetical protein